MCAEKNNDKKEKGFSCCDSEGAAEMMKNCFPDDAGYTDCFTMMKKMQEKFCGQQTAGAAKEEKKGCCG
jgi:hypothetical protein